MSLRVSERLRAVERTLIRRVFDSAPPDAINLGLGQPDLPTPDVVSLAGVAGIAAGETRYTTTAGDPELREAIAARYHAAAPADPSRVTVTVGSQEAMYASLLALTDPGDEVLYPDPGYPAYPVIVRMLGAEPLAYRLAPEHRFRLRADDVLGLVGDRTRCVILCAPGNPTGAVHAPSELGRVVAELERRGVAWISDEVYAGLSYVTETPGPLDLAPDGGVVVSGLSKTHSMTGWRIGWATGSAPLIAKITAAHQYLVTCAPSVSQVAARAAFSPAGDHALREMLARFSKRRERMAAELARIEGAQFDRPDGGFYYFVDFRRFGPSSLRLSEAILSECNVITVPGIAFGPGGEGFLRLSFAAAERDIVEGVGRIGEWLARRATSQ